MDETSIYYLYMLECVNGSYYTGYTTNIVRRYSEHQKGSAKCKYTRAFPPRYLAMCWMLETTQCVAMRLEHQIKSMPRQRKIALIQSPDKLLLAVTSCVDNCRVIKTGSSASCDLETFFS